VNYASKYGISWGKRRPVRKADNLPQFCAVVTKCGNNNFLETSGPLRACKATALPFTGIKQNPMRYCRKLFIIVIMRITQPYWTNRD